LVKKPLGKRPLKDSEENQTSAFSYLYYREVNCEVGGKIKEALENQK
jgi:hypothetical protein